MQATEVSPGLPAMVPQKASAVLMAWPATSCKGCSTLPTLVATCPSGVAPVKASLTGPLPPKPRAALVFTKARSPLIFDG